MTERKRNSKKSKWMGSTDSGAYDPPTELELEALSLLGPHSLRDGAIEGVSDAVLDGSAGPLEQPDPSIPHGPRRSPEFVPDAGIGDGGISVSGGAAGGADPGSPDPEEIVDDTRDRGAH